MSRYSSKDLLPARELLYHIEHVLRPDFILGVDEVGYGAWAGPLVVGGSATPCGWRSPLVKDSKMLSERARVKAVRALDEQGILYLTKSAESVVIDIERVHIALRRLIVEVLQALVTRLPATATYAAVLDGTSANVPSGLSYQVAAVPKADVIVPAVGAASVVAKVTRDGYMQEYHQCYPHYGWDSNKGYGTQAHHEGLLRYGPCPLHRMSYSNISELCRTRPIETKS